MIIPAITSPYRDMILIASLNTPFVRNGKQEVHVKINTLYYP